MKNLLARLRQNQKSVLYGADNATNTLVKNFKNLHIQKIELFYLYIRE